MLYTNDLIPSLYCNFGLKTGESKVLFKVQIVFLQLQNYIFFHKKKDHKNKKLQMQINYKEYLYEEHFYPL